MTRWKEVICACWIPMRKPDPHACTHMPNPSTRAPGPHRARWIPRTQAPGPPRRHAGSPSVLAPSPHACTRTGSSCVHAPGPHECMHTQTGPPRMEACKVPCTHARQIPMYVRWIPTRPVSKFLSVLAPGPHACTCWIPMDPHAACFGISLVVQ
jgi:hypothetical protein